MVKKEGKTWKAEILTAENLRFSKTFQTKLEATNFENYILKTFCEKKDKRTEVGRTKKMSLRAFVINGCKVKPAWTGVRCFGLSQDCPFYNSCLTAVAKKGWNGWKVIDILDDKEEVMEDR
jgi:hypothetical protein